ncbi:MAG: HAMP domain-containing histidine kinase [Clostridia bacterium]|nr:HAMP domain-containing histidine kinase [Clostridia bacterium]
MRKNSTILKKQLGITMGIVFCSYVLIGVMMVLFFSQFWRTEKKDLLLQNASLISAQASNYQVQPGGTFDEHQLTELELVCRSMSVVIGADVMITDAGGQPLVRSYAAVDTVRPGEVNPFIMQRVEKGGYVGNGKFNGLYDDSHYVIGLPIAGADGTMVGAVFTAVALQELSVYLFNIVRVILFVSLVSILLAFMIIGVFSYRMVIPLRKMAVAAREMGAGNFSVRVPNGGDKDDEIGQLAEAFNSMAVSLSNSENANRSFIANVSHELKTPMTTIAGFIDGIVDGTIPPEDQKKYLRIVSVEVKRLSRLVRTMLDLSRIDNGELRLTKAKHDISPIVVDVMLSFEKKIEDKQLDIRGMEELRPVVIDCDADMIHQVVYNLVDNAVKFTNPGGYIAVAVREHGGWVNVAIENSGEGISPTELSMIFDRFYKTDKSRARDKNGMGLGLFIVRSMINLHGGEIRACSVQNEFTRFEFTLPVSDGTPDLKEGPRSRTRQGGDNGMLRRPNERSDDQCVTM